MGRRAGLCLGALVAGGLSLLAGLARADGPPAANDPYAYAPPPERLFYNWSGIYAGGLIGGSTSRWASLFNNLEAPRSSSNDVVLGGQIGYQHQFRDVVLGAEVSYSAIGAKVVSPSTTSAGLTTTSELDSIVHVNGKVGYAYMNYLMFVKGGYALGSINTSTSGTLAASSSGTAHGWMAGAGVSYAVHRNIILGVEYNYTRLNLDSLILTDTVTTARYTTNHWDVQQVMLRLDFKLGPH